MSVQTKPMTAQQLISRTKMSPQIAQSIKFKDLIDYKPYSLANNTSDNRYVDIIFQNEGLMTVPKTTGVAIVDLLNDAFRNGVKMTIQVSDMKFWISDQDQSTVNLDPEFKPNLMPKEEEHPINKQVKRL